MMPAMRIERRDVGEVAVVEVEGRLVRGVGDEILRRELSRLLHEERRGKVLVNLRQVPFIDSSGIGELVAAKRTADEIGADLKLVELGEKVAHTLRLSMILPLFATYPSEEAALAAFAAPAAGRA
jgi:anti-sigma B factor antagonist